LQTYPGDNFFFGGDFNIDRTAPITQLSPMQQ
jgi:hypothetical protein